ncbi:acetylglucosaminyltransferase (predicted) [Sugiyamaella lignohabitans]|uniref:Acetylglucosaminyltransferase (Predicted) n=1 Tax=Sugiyamaella lignohabitans TaxID=796027 RepID=A0A161HHE1_9ASCO|nr:acetylglucosaminyltransferase (predicted) [Sugiyamaella lignohabitans]ANB11547.1 acetylglucosaminyltransferase (predicted) [Sugiyamaella lignohabitans]
MPVHIIDSEFHPKAIDFNGKKSKVGIVTFLSTRHSDNTFGDGIDPEKTDKHLPIQDHHNEKDDFFNATRVLAYKLLRDPKTKTQKDIPFLVMVTKTVDQWKRDQLMADGAHVFEVDYIPVLKSMQRGEKRWLDQYTKLRLFELTNFDRMLYMDADMLVTRSLDGIFEDPASYPIAAPENKAEHIPDEYLLAGVDDVYGTNNPIPRPPSDSFNAGFFVFKPSTDLFTKYHLMMSNPGLYNSNQMEQGLLNYVHRLNGNLPWQRLTPGKWSVTWPSYTDYKYGVATLHDKVWLPTRDSRLRELWMKDYKNMVAANGEVRPITVDEALEDLKPQHTATQISEPAAKTEATTVSESVAPDSEGKVENEVVPDATAVAEATGTPVSDDSLAAATNTGAIESSKPTENTEVEPTSKPNIGTSSSDIPSDDVDDVKPEIIPAATPVAEALPSSTEAEAKTDEVKSDELASIQIEDDVTVGTDTTLDDATNETESDETPYEAESTPSVKVAVEGTDGDIV